MVTSRGRAARIVLCRCVFLFAYRRRLFQERRRIIALWQTKEVPEKPAWLAFSFAMRPKACQKLPLQGNFVNRRPGLTVAELLDVLKITKQSLARVLKQLIDTDHVVQLQGPRDRRQRELYPTARGRALALALARPQSRRIHAALEDSGITE